MLRYASGRVTRSGRIPVFCSRRAPRTALSREVKSHLMSLETAVSSMRREVADLYADVVGDAMMACAAAANR